MRFISKAASRLATTLPTRPRPTIPTVFPFRSKSLKRLRSHLPACMDAFASASCRASASMIEIVCSAAETLFEPGAFSTSTPAFVAAATSMLSTPTPARAITRNRGALRIRASSTCVSLRTTRPSAPAIACCNATISVPSTSTISASRASSALAVWSMTSLMTICGLIGCTTGLLFAISLAAASSRSITGLTIPSGTGARPSARKNAVTPAAW